MAYKVLLSQDIAEPGKNYLLERGYELVPGTGVTEDAVIRDIADCDALINRTGRITPAVLEAGKKLKVIAKHGVGYDNIDAEAAARMGVTVTNTPESNSRSVAEFTMGMILVAVKKIAFLRDAFLDGDFGLKAKNKGMDVQGKLLGVVGFGRIGGLVAKMACAGFDMKVLAYDPYLPADRFPA